MFDLKDSPTRGGGTTRINFVKAEYPGQSRPRSRARLFSRTEFHFCQLRERFMFECFDSKSLWTCHVGSQTPHLIKTQRNEN